MDNDVKALRPDDAIPLPLYADDTQGANGFEWRMVWMLQQEAGNHAIHAMKAENPYERQWHQWHERMCDRIAERIIRELPPIQETTNG